MDLTVEKFTWANDNKHSYLLTCSRYNRCIVIDPPERTNHTWQEIDQTIKVNGLCLSWILHTTFDPAQLCGAGAYKKSHICAQSAVGIPADISSDCCQHYDRLFADGDCVQMGYAIGHVVNLPATQAPRTQYQFDQFQFLGDADRRVEANCHGQPIYLARTA